MAPLCKGSCRRSGLSGCFSLRLRTVMTLRDIPVFRSAYSASRNARAPAASRPSVGGGASLSPFSAPNQLFKLLRCSAWLIFRFRTDPPSVRRCSARLIRQAETLELQPRSQPPSKRTALSELKTLMLQVRSAHPPMPHRNVFSKHPGVPVGLFSDSAPTHLRCAGVPLGLFGKPKRSSFSRVRGLHQAILWPLLQNARPSGSLRSPSDAAPKCFFKTFRCSARLIRQAETLGSSRFAAFGGRGGFALPFLRTEMPFSDIPVFRMAYSVPTAHCAVGAETLMLQVRSAHPPVGGGSFAPPAPPLPPPRILERQTGTPFGLYSAKEASLPSQRLRGCPLPLPLPLCYHKHK